MHYDHEGAIFIPNGAEVSLSAIAGVRLKREYPQSEAPWLLMDLCKVLNASLGSNPLNETGSSLPELIRMKNIKIGFMKDAIDVVRPYVKLGPYNRPELDTRLVDTLEQEIISFTQ